MLNPQWSANWCCDLASLLWRLCRATIMETGLFEIQADHLNGFREAKGVQGVRGPDAPPMRFFAIAVRSSFYTSNATTASERSDLTKSDQAKSDRSISGLLIGT